ncbi:MAG: patatin [Alphaproteobacteria bacterium CG_4_10_14_0_2_um_filter_63_37]|nr:MAG: hypothetical protein AUJ55_06895 [Proteobacteria bacterium CG1_02_64_396]PJA24732.1 MAG: patatin [Alphaproteobacteria bacterium CG_4_10_14_0_2_um_filter_63_37]
MTPISATPRIGLALGSGSARGWAHIGAIRALHEMGIHPHIVAGCSIGALVGGAYAGGYLERLEAWVQSLTWREVLRFMDPGISGGGMFAGDRLVDFFKSRIGEPNIESFPLPFGAVATDMLTGREVWLRQGPVIDAVRASIALPGIFRPHCVDNRWLIDGGVVNPVPVSLCKAMGAEVVIAVNLNGDIVGRAFAPHQLPKKVEEARDFWDKVADRFPFLRGSEEESSSKAKSKAKAKDCGIPAPGLFDVMAGSLNIMQERITNSRMAGDPPDVIVTPRLAHIGLMEFDRAEEAMAEGHEAVVRVASAIRDAVGLTA